MPDFGIRLHPVDAVSSLARTTSMLLFDIYDIYDDAMPSARGRRPDPGVEQMVAYVQVQVVM
jgi:hypothetical protein